MNSNKSLSHANFDSELRFRKAKKIEAIVAKNNTFGRKAMLEVGVGSGFIANYFSAAIYGGSRTFAVDVVDERQVTEGFDFKLVEGTTLPFTDESFDFIITNHVVEHVGASEDQKAHVNEIYRCLEPGGVLYFAVPNRWRFIEPHYKLPLLSWFPNVVASTYVRLFRRGSYYDCNLLSRREAIKLLSSAGFEFKDATLDAVSILGEIEGSFIIKWIAKFPKVFWMPFLVIMPTLIFVCRKPML